MPITRVIGFGPVMLGYDYEPGVWRWVWPFSIRRSETVTALMIQFGPITAAIGLGR